MDPVKEAWSVDYLALLRDEYDKKLLEHARPLAYASLEVDARFDARQFKRVLVDLADIVAVPTRWLRHLPKHDPWTRARAVALIAAVPADHHRYAGLVTEVGVSSGARAAGERARLAAGRCAR